MQIPRWILGSTLFHVLVPFGVWSPLLGFGQCFFLFLSLFSLGLCCCAWVSLVAGSRGYSLVVAHRLDHGMWRSSQTRDGTWVRCIGRPDSSHRLPGESTAFLLKLSLLTRKALVRTGGRGWGSTSLFLLSEGEGRVCACACAPLSTSLKGALLEPMSLGPRPSICYDNRFYEDIGSMRIVARGWRERTKSQCVSDRRTLW